MSDTDSTTPETAHDGDLQSSDAAAFALLADLDAVDPLPPAATRRAVASAARAIGRWSDDGAVVRPAGPVRRTRFPWWTYPTSAAAAALLAFLVWWGNTDPAPVELAADPRPGNAYADRFAGGYGPGYGGRLGWGFFGPDEPDVADLTDGADATHGADPAADPVDGPGDVLPEALQGYVLLPPPSLGGSPAGVAGRSADDPFAGLLGGPFGGPSADPAWPGDDGSAERDLAVLQGLRDLTAADAGA